MSFATLLNRLAKLFDEVPVAFEEVDEPREEIRTDFEKASKSRRRGNTSPRPLCIAFILLCPPDRFDPPRQMARRIRGGQRCARVQCGASGGARGFVPSGARGGRSTSLF